MRESVQLDLLGQLRLDFEPTTLTFTQSPPPTLPAAQILRRRRAINTPIPYTEIQSIETLTRRQWWLLLPGLLFTLMGPIWTAGALTTTPPNWPVFTIGLLWFLFLGILPLLLLAKGRPYLAILSPTHAILLPIDRKQAKIRRILGLLHQACPPTATSWNIRHPNFSPATLDLRPPTGLPPNTARLTLIITLAGIYGLANILYTLGHHTLALTLLAALPLIALAYITYKRLKKPPAA